MRWSDSDQEVAGVARRRTLELRYLRTPRAVLHLPVSDLRRKLNREEILGITEDWRLGRRFGDDVGSLRDSLGFTETEMQRWYATGEPPYMDGEA
jgi:hypothetical protein